MEKKDTNNITQTEEKLIASEFRYRRLFEAARDGILILDAETGMIEGVNPFLMEMLGYAYNDFIGKQLWEIGFLKDIVANKATFLKLQEERYVRYENLPLKTREGLPIWVEFVSNVYDVSGKQVIQCNIRNITDRKFAEEKVHKSEEKYKDLIENINDLICIHDLDGLIISVNKSAEKNMGYKFDPQANLNIKNILTSDSRPGFESYIADIQKNGFAKGVMKVQIPDGEIHTWEYNNSLKTNGVERPFVMGYARDITENKKAEKKLKESENKYHSFFDQSADAIFIFDETGHFLDVNIVSTSLLKYTKKEFANMSLTDMVFSEDLAATPIRFDLLVDGESVIRQRRLKRKDGSAVEVEIHSKKMPDGNFLGVVRDITERNEAEKKLKETTNRLQHIYNTLDNSFWGVDIVNNKTLYLSPGSKKIYGYPAKDFMDNPNLWLELALDEDKHKFDALFPLLNKGEQAIVEYRIRNADSSIKWVESRMTPTLDATGKLIMLDGITIDINERKKAVENLRQLSLAVEQSPASVIITDIKGNIQYVNQKFTEISGYTSEEMMGKNPRILKSGHTSDAEYENLWKQITSGLEWKGELHNKKKNGELYWESVLISPIFNEKGEVISFLAFKEDITERKKAENLLFDSQQNYKELLENMNDGFIVDDISGKITFANKRFLEIFGLTDDDLNEFTIEDYVAPDYVEMLRDRHNRRITGEKVSGVFIFEGLRKNGENIWLEVSVNHIIKNEIIAGTQSVITDITERKKAEISLQESEETFKQLFKESADPILLLDDIGFIECNQSAASILGYYSPQEVLIKQPWEISPEKQPDGRLSIEKAKAMIAKALMEGYNIFEWVHTKFDGTEFPVEVMLTPILIKGKQFYYTIWRDLYERKKAEADLKLMEQKILDQKIQEQKKIARAIIKAQEKERNHMGQELHDNVNQILAATKMYLGMTGGDEEMKELIKYPMELIDSAIQEIRLLSHKNVTPLKDINLIELLQSLVNDLEKNTSIKTVLKFDLADQVKNDDLILNIYRIIQEQVNNILKHAAAKNVSITVKTFDHILQIITTDDGKGFDVNKTRKGIGISNMTNRIETFNGKIEIKSSPGNGCKIIIEIPF